MKRAVLVVLGAALAFHASARVVVVPVDLSAIQPPPFAGSYPMYDAAPAASSDGVGYFIVWVDSDGFIKGLRVTSTGTLIDGVPVVISQTTAMTNPSLVFDGTNYLVVWADEGGVMGAWVSSAGELLGSQFQVAACPDQYVCDYGNPKIAFNGSAYLVTWVGTTAHLEGGSAWYPTRSLAGRLLVSDGAGFVTTPLVIYDQGPTGCYRGCLHPEVSLASGTANFLTVYNLTSSMGPYGLSALVGSDGALTPSGWGLNDHGFSTPAVIFAGGKYHVLFNFTPHYSPVDTDLWDEQFSPDGEAVAAVELADEVDGYPGTFDDFSPAAAFDGTAMLAVWLRNGTFARRFLPDDTPIDGEEITISPGTVAGLSAASDGRTFLVAWEGGGAIIADDEVPPAISTPPTVAATATSIQGALVDYSVSAVDDVSGAVPVTCSPASGTTFLPGVTTVSCAAADLAGNVGTATFRVEVTFSWSGILPPIDPAGRSRFKLGRTVPVKFALTGASGAIGNLDARLFLAKQGDGAFGVEREAASTSAADTGNTFRFDPAGSQYVFNLATRGLTAGTWRLRIDLGDAVEHFVWISLRN